MPRPSLRQIVSIFFRHGNWTFGGGSATVAVLQTELVERDEWVSRQEFALAFGLARLTPGTNLLAFGVGVGWLLRKSSGALAALLAGSIPCSVLALLVTALYESWRHNRFVMIGLRGALPAAVGVMVATGWTLLRPYWKETSLLRLVPFTGVALASGLLSISPIRVLVAAAIIGFLWPEGEKV